jgi:predicted RNA-binding Zn-ribbon protein involved in translation (DUF1610 family)
MGTKRAIAMRCNQQQFDAVKDQLTNTLMVTNFDKSEYLVNCFKEDYTTNLELEYASAWANEVHHEWNADVFLEACGIDKAWRSDELEFYNTLKGKWTTLGDGTTDIRVKPIDLQLELQLEIVSKSGINIVTCGDCGSTVLHRQSEETVTCPDCGFSGDPCDFPDLNY